MWRIFNYFESQKIKSGIFLKSLIKIDLKLKIKETEQLNKILYLRWEHWQGTLRIDIFKKCWMIKQCFMQILTLQVLQMILFDPKSWLSSVINFIKLKHKTLPRESTINVCFLFNMFQDFSYNKVPSENNCKFYININSMNKYESGGLC